MTLTIKVSFKKVLQAILHQIHKVPTQICRRVRSDTEGHVVTDEQTDAWSEMNTTNIPSLNANAYIGLNNKANRSKFEVKVFVWDYLQHFLKWGWVVQA